ncbi:predicted protein [Clavispora lusitaniae ATCC 42720]|uniref:Uncharacterized protein n=1 Tax=Clavispora lusitaniae (strain ATCC 42720) TaxID=306902 RepID=C4Y1A7_CLAL4|nr:uncharacterized protein CLUG_01989 [Clavispora lusitaniae ATCC 42720]EEQ37866.1 predicted protein [Clavispora lusitaniae ATCC 42720]
MCEPPRPKIEEARGSQALDEANGPPDGRQKRRSRRGEHGPQCILCVVAAAKGATPSEAGRQHSGRRNWTSVGAKSSWGPPRGWKARRLETWDSAIWDLATWDSATKTRNWARSYWPVSPDQAGRAQKACAHRQKTPGGFAAGEAAAPTQARRPTQGRC